LVDYIERRKERHELQKLPRKYHQNENLLNQDGEVMENVAEVVALLRKQAQLESQIINGTGTAIACEQELAATRRRLAAHPQALNAVLQTAQALRRSPDAVSVREVAEFGWAN
jgi:hypothetical protein